MKHLKKTLVSMLMILASVVTFSACSTEDILDEIMGNEEWYIVLDKVDTNLVDANGNLLTQQIYNDFTFNNGKKEFKLGKSDSALLKPFEESCNNLKSALFQLWNGNMPKGGWITYSFSLRKGSPTGNVEMTKSITIN